MRILSIAIWGPFALEIFGVYDIFGLSLNEFLLSGLVVVTMKRSESEWLISIVNRYHPMEVSAVLEESGLTSPQRRDRRRSQTSWQAKRKRTGGKNIQELHKRVSDEPSVRQGFGKRSTMRRR